MELQNANQTMALLGIKENAFNRFRKINPDFPATTAWHRQKAVFKIGSDRIYQ